MAKGKGKRKVGAGDVASNRYASYRYELIERLECGIVLEGTEVKALRTSGAQLKDGYASLKDGELWLHSVHIPPTARLHGKTTTRSARASCCCTAASSTASPTRVAERGLTLVPTRIYFSGAAREGRGRAGAWQGSLRQARDDPRPRDQARHGTRRSRSAPLRLRRARLRASRSCAGRCGGCGLASMPSASSTTRPR